VGSNVICCLFSTSHSQSFARRRLTPAIGESFADIVYCSVQR